MPTTKIALLNVKNNLPMRPGALAADDNGNVKNVPSSQVKIWMDWSFGGVCPSNSAVVGTSSAITVLVNNDPKIKSNGAINFRWVRVFIMDLIFYVFHGFELGLGLLTRPNWRHVGLIIEAVQHRNSNANSFDGSARFDELFRNQFEVI